VNVKKCVRPFVNPYNVAAKIPESTLRWSLVVLARMPNVMAVLTGHTDPPVV
jgi:hypothetical protein